MKKMFGKIKMYFVNKILLINKEIQITKARWTAKSPVFFIKLKWLSIKIGGPAAAVLAANNAMTLNLNPDLITKLEYLVAVCVAIAGTSQLTVEDSTRLPN
jgi:hypothetical protein